MMDFQELLYFIAMDEMEREQRKAVPSPSLDFEDTTAEDEGTKNDRPG